MVIPMLVVCIVRDQEQNSHSRELQLQRKSMHTGLPTPDWAIKAESTCKKNNSTHKAAENIAGHGYGA
jgi:hypothetical protein